MGRISAVKILVTGSSGQLGKAVVRELNGSNHEVIPTDREMMDITKETRVRAVLDEVKPDAVIHCAAYTNVDYAEEDRKSCRKVNVCGTGYLAKWCGERDIKFLYVSTDYVFSGEGETPFCEEDEKKPLNIYGQSKHEAEELVKKYLKNWYIVRTSWLFGDGVNFVTAILDKARKKRTLQVIEDQIGSPTYTEDLAVTIRKLIETERYGIYHVTNTGVCSWYEFACAILKCAEVEAEVRPVKTEQYPQKAVRPKNSRLAKNKLEAEGLGILPHWEDALKRYIACYHLS